MKSYALLANWMEDMMYYAANYHANQWRIDNYHIYLCNEPTFFRKVNVNLGGRFTTQEKRESYDRFITI